MNTATRSFPTLASLLGTSTRLPAVPAVLSRLLAEAQSPDCGTARMAELVASDPVLAAKTLRLANSSYFHRAQRIVSIDHAIQLLGFSMVRTMALAASLQDAFGSLRGFDLKAFWRHSARTAAVAGWLSRHGSIDRDMATTVGLMHAIGLLHMRMVLVEESKTLDALCPPLEAGRAEAERQELGFDHAAVAEGLAQAWRFPPALAQALGAVSRPEPGSPSFPLALLVHAAADISRGRADGLSLEQSPLTGLQAARSVAGGALEVQDMRGAWIALPPWQELCRGFEPLLA